MADFDKTLACIDGLVHAMYLRKEEHSIRQAYGICYHSSLYYWLISKLQIFYGTPNICQ
jgi:hypothetical protein